MAQLYKRVPFPLHPLATANMRLQYSHDNAAVWIGHLFLLSIITLSVYLLLTGRRDKGRPSSNKPNPPPSPPKLPLLGNLHQLGSLPHRSLHALSRKYGPLMLVHFGCVPTVIVSSASVAHDVMKTHDLVFASRPHSSTADRLLYGCQDVAFAPYGEYWRQVRRICVLHLLSPKLVQSFRPVREEEIGLVVEKIRASSSPVRLSDMISALANDIVCRVAFGRKYSTGGEGEEEGGGKRACELLAELEDLLGEFPVRDFIPCFSWIDRLRGLDAKLSNNFQQLDALIEKVFEDHLQHNSNREVSNKSFVDILLSLGKDATNGSSLSRTSMKALTLDMYAGGTDTTSTTLEWIMTELIGNREAMKRVQEEVRGVVEQGEDVIEEDIDRMKYLKAVIKETLRLHPPVPLLVPRESREDIQLCGYHIPARTRVMVNAWAIGRDPTSWDRPEEFRPDRFMDSSIDFRGQDFQLIPFGAGRRGCPGIGFAMATVELALANLLHHFDWAMPDGGTNGKGMEMSERFGLTIHKKSGLILVAKPGKTSVRCNKP